MKTELSVTQMEICEEEYQRHGAAGSSNAVLAINKRWQRKGGYRKAVQDWFYHRKGLQARKNKGFTYVLPKAQTWADVITESFLDLPDQINLLYS